MSTDASFIGGCATLLLVSTLAAAGGIGGGALNVPVLLSVFGYDYKKAVVLSLCAVFGNVVSQLFVNWSKSHPLDTTRPLIYWDVALMLLPSALGGNNIGVILAKILPTTAMMILAIIVVAYAVYKTLSKGWHLYQIETAGGADKAPVIGDTTRPLLWDEEEGDGDAVRNRSRNGSAVSIGEQAGAGEGVGTGGHADSAGAKASVVILENRIIDGASGGVKVLSDGASIRGVRARSSSGSASAVLAASFGDSGAGAGRPPPMAGPAGVGDSSRTSSVADASGTSMVVTEVDVPASAIREHSMQRAQRHRSTSKSSDVSLLLAPVIDIATKTESAPSPDEIIVPTDKICLIILTLIFFVLVSLGMTLQPKCSTGYWLTLALSYPILVVFVFYSIEVIAKAQSEDPASILPGDIDVTHDRVSRPVLAFLIGVVCSLLGIGGGELFGPLMLSMGIIPQVSSASTSVLSLVSSINNIIHHLILGDVPYGPAVAVFLVGVTGGAVGRMGALHITKAFGRPSFLIFVLGTILAISCAILINDVATERPEFAIDDVCS